ncbi:hypothetical protein BX600DRAFT_431806 [Xylariales sp. PMI_506]|nr:hypothetical protein BX600DRAFT_431806 [Xylariales sp. PMI_506]
MDLALHGQLSAAEAFCVSCQTQPFGTLEITDGRLRKMEMHFGITPADSTIEVTVDNLVHRLRAVRTKLFWNKRVTPLLLVQTNETIPENALTAIIRGTSSVLPTKYSDTNEEFRAMAGLGCLAVSKGAILPRWKYDTPTMWIVFNQLLDMPDRYSLRPDTTSGALDLPLYQGPYQGQPPSTSLGYSAFKRDITDIRNMVASLQGKDMEEMIKRIIKELLKEYTKDKQKVRGKGKKDEENKAHKARAKEKTGKRKKGQVEEEPENSDGGTGHDKTDDSDATDSDATEYSFIN